MSILYYKTCVEGRGEPEYNILLIAGSSLGVIPSEETKMKISKALKGRSLLEEHKQNISASMLGQNSGENHPNSVKIEVTDLELKTKTTFGSIREAARALKIPQSRITKSFSQNQ